MVGNGHATHTIGHSLVYESRYARLTIEQRELSMYVKMYEVLHQPNILLLSEIFGYKSTKKYAKTTHRHPFLYHKCQKHHTVCWFSPFFYLFLHTKAFKFHKLRNGQKTP